MNSNSIKKKLINKGIKSPGRVTKLIQDAINSQKLDLKDLIVLTEAANSYYSLTSIICAMAGAEKVYAIAKDSKYATIDEVKELTYLISDYIGINKETIEIVTEKHLTVIKQADIVTNLGFVRPINKEFISYMKDTAVIPLMKETWEFREGDIDLNECKKKGIPVLGTNENHPDLRIFDYLGHLCAKKLFELDIEIYKSNVAVIGGGEFGFNIMKYLALLGANVYGIYEENNNELIKIGVKKITRSLKAIDINMLRDLDCLIITTYPDTREIIGTKGLINPRRLKKINPGISIIQFMGNVDRKSIINTGILMLPKTSVPPNTMPWTLNELGPKPVIDLHTGGLKVGEIMAKLRRKGYSLKEAMEKALENILVQDFSTEQKNKFMCRKRNLYEK